MTSITNVSFNSARDKIIITFSDAVVGSVYAQWGMRDLMIELDGASWEIIYYSSVTGIGTNSVSFPITPSPPGNYTIRDDGGTFFVDTNGTEVVTNHSVQEWVETTTAPICFAKGTIISTDQGNMEIQNIVPGKHTICKKAICHITKTISPEKKIVCVKKNAFGKNKPNKAITMSGNHCIQCEKGAMVKAKELVASNPKMKFVDYNQEPLYNVLMEDHNVIKVQNLEVETLDPENIVAKIYNSVMDKSTLAKLVKQMNEGIRENNREKYISAEYEIKKRG